MKTLLNEMVFDTEMIHKMKSTPVQKEILYVQLISGKITLKEYLELSR